MHTDFSFFVCSHYIFQHCLLLRPTALLPLPPPPRVSMEKLRHCIDVQAEALTSLNTNFLCPLRAQVAAQDSKTVTLATHARLYRMEKLATSATELLAIERAMLEWMSTLKESHVQPLRAIIGKTLTTIETVM